MRREYLLRFFVRRTRVCRAIFFPLNLCFALVVIARPSAAQHNHDLNHGSYQNWVNKQDKGCCNNQDCGEVADEDVRENGPAYEVKIEGNWCEVKPWMYLKTGNAPNWSSAHVCVLQDRAGLYGLLPRPACDRLLCFQPKPQF